jgi:hypothetical protein
MLASPLALTQACSKAKKPVANASVDASLTTAEVKAEPEAPPPLVGECAPVELDAAIYDDSGSGCARYLRLPCGIPADAGLRGCWPDLLSCIQVCRSAFRCQLAPNVTCRMDGTLIPDASAVYECMQCSSGGGRRPRGLQAKRKEPREGSLVGTYFADLAYLEAASVDAFQQLHRTLTRLNAPPALVRRAKAAVVDERRHAGATRRLAQRFGASPARPQIASGSEPSLEELLLDNAQEGCVGESYGALVALFQAEHANDACIAHEMRTIAGDEAEHAALSWDILAWGLPKLDDGARARVLDRLTASVTALKATADRHVDACLVERAGHPSVADAQRLVDHFERFVRDNTERLWNAAA